MIKVLYALLVCSLLGIFSVIAAPAHAQTYVLEKSNGKIYTYNTGKYMLSSGSIDNVLLPEDANDPVLHVYDVVITLNGLVAFLLQFRDKETNKYDTYKIISVE